MAAVKIKKHRVKRDMDMDELLVKYLAGEADQKERARAELWIEADEENRKYFEHFRLIWEQSQKLASTSNIDENAAWERFRARVQTAYYDPPKPKYYLKWIGVAAALVIITGLAVFVPYFIKRNDDIRTVIPVSPRTEATFIKKVTSNQVETDSLPDGSVVTLNKYSTLSFAPSFTGNKRYAKLAGEAFFNVRHDPAKPFIIETNDLLITVLGTSFNVKSRGDTTEVIVETGIVGVKKEQQIITLNAGEKLTALLGAPTFTKASNTDNSYRSYFDKGVIAQTKPAQLLKPNAVKGKTDSVLDFKKHPDLLQKILKDPAKWSQILKNYHAQGNDITVRRAVIRNVIADIQQEQLLGKDTVRSFRLNESELVINDKRQPDAVHQRFKDKYIKEPGYVIYFGGLPRTGKGIYLSPDSL
ncbi:MAG TPA: FecR domain-containing protein [Mucilaginibacter sp.]|jgi:ferric-dicitrate binding protein FerR (iron transport regulator)|nr:FecR domain-containing protein [Mucilaginibacter sp.]